MVNKITTPPTQKGVVDKINEVIDDKANIDLSDITNPAKKLMANMAMPSGTYDNLTAGSSGTVYTAPSNGYFVAEGTSNTENNTNHPLLWYLMNDSGTTAVCLLSANTTPYAGATIALSTAVRKGGKYRLDYGRMASINVKFIYAVGSESEAN